jgi:hypothetical protein
VCIAWQPLDLKTTCTCVAWLSNSVLERANDVRSNDGQPCIPHIYAVEGFLLFLWLSCLLHAMCLLRREWEGKLHKCNVLDPETTTLEIKRKLPFLMLYYVMGSIFIPHAPSSHSMHAQVVCVLIVPLNLFLMEVILANATLGFRALLA